MPGNTPPTTAGSGTGSSTATLTVTDAVTPVPPVGTGTDLPPPAPSAATTQATQHVKSVVGSTVTEKLKNYTFDPAEQAAVTQRVRDKAQAAGEQAYDVAVQKGSDEKKAKKEATRAVQETARAEAIAEAERAAREAAQRALASGTAFNVSALDADATAQLTNYPTTAFEAKRIGPALAGKSATEFLAFMSQEVNEGKVTAPGVRNIAAPPPHLGTQAMQMWEYSDGTVVRYKPLGDKERPNPTYSIEVKKNPALPDSGPEGAAFKVDLTGAPVPKKPEEAIANPYPKSPREQYDAFDKEIMDAGHRSLTP